MATQNNDPEPNTSVPHDEPAEADTSDPKTVSPDQPDTGTTVPHDDV